MLKTSNFGAELLLLLFRTWKVLGSNVDPNTSCSGSFRGFRQFSQANAKVVR